MKKLSLVAVLLAAAAAHAGSPDNRSAGENAPAVERRVVKADDGSVKYIDEVTTGPAKYDTNDKDQGNQYDLAVDGAFEGQTVAVLHFYTGQGFDFSLPALKEKGVPVFRWIDQPPPAKELEETLKGVSQLWLISSLDRRLTDEHVAVIKRFFDAGGGVYIWGDNDPYYADANVVGQALLGVERRDDVWQAAKKTGVRKGHLLSTGFYAHFTRHVVTAYDGQPPALPATSNAAAWQTNAERFGDAVSSGHPENPIAEVTP